MQGLVLLLLIPVFWLLIIRPQQQQRRAHQAVVATLEVGDRVMTVGGVIGTLTEVGAETVRLDVGDGTQLTFGRTFVRQRVDGEPVADSPTMDSTSQDDHPSTEEAAP